MLISGVLEEGKKGDRMKNSVEEELQSDGEFDVVEKDEQNKYFEFLYVEDVVEVYDSEDECKVDLDYVYEVEFYLSVFY